MFIQIVDGQWSSWSSWSFCTKTCGDLEGGQRIRTRSCTRPMPKAGGLECQGESKQTSSCGNSCFHFAVLDGSSIEVHVIDEPGIIHLDPSLPSGTNDTLGENTMIPWNNGIIFCLWSSYIPCQHWNTISASWTQMKSRPHLGFILTMVNVNGKIWLPGGYFEGARLGYVQILDHKFCLVIRCNSQITEKQLSSKRTQENLKQDQIYPKLEVIRLWFKYLKPKFCWLVEQAVLDTILTLGFTTICTKTSPANPMQI